MDKKVKELTRLLCRWNRRELEASELANELWKLFEKEVLETWNDPLEELIV